MVNKQKVGGERWVIVGDTQCPFHDPRAVELAAMLIEDIKPDHLIENGDMPDFWTLSSHNKRRHEILNNVGLQGEIDITMAIEDKLVRKSPKTRRHKIDGNHEYRLETFLGNGPQSVLAGLKNLTMEEVFQYGKRGYTSYYPYGQGINITNNLFVYHGEYVGTLPGDSVKKEIIARGSSIVMNHVHRRADILFRQGTSEHRGIENGCLCQLAAGYKAMTNWSHCITLVTVYDNRHWFSEVIDFITDEEDGEMYAVFRGNKYAVPLSYHDGLAQPWRFDKIEQY